jgi:hypothetical protein
MMSKLIRIAVALSLFVGMIGLGEARPLSYYDDDDTVVWGN